MKRVKVMLNPDAVDYDILNGLTGTVVAENPSDSPKEGVETFKVRLDKKTKFGLFVNFEKTELYNID